MRDVRLEYLLVDLHIRDMASTAGNNIRGVLATA
jgi:hypothetical protein